MSLTAKLVVVAGQGAAPAALVRALDAQGQECALIVWGAAAEASLIARARFHVRESGDAALMPLLAALSALREEGFAMLAALGRPPYTEAGRGNAKVLNHQAAEILEGMGWSLRAPCDLAVGLGIGEGLLDSAMAITDEGRRALALAWRAAGMVGELGAGQGAVACGGVVSGLEAIDGTDAMLRRVAELAPSARVGGVLVKRMMPGQDRRLDLPAIGTTTLALAAAAGLAGIGLEAGGAVLIDAASVAAEARRRGLWILGCAPGGL